LSFVSLKVWNVLRRTITPHAQTHTRLHSLLVLHELKPFMWYKLFHVDWRTGFSVENWAYYTLSFFILLLCFWIFHYSYAFKTTAVCKYIIIIYYNCRIEPHSYLLVIKDKVPIFKVTWTCQIRNTSKQSGTSYWCFINLWLIFSVYKLKKNVLLFYNQMNNVLLVSIYTLIIIIIIYRNYFQYFNIHNGKLIILYTLFNL